jgi:hypothetical protein
MAETLLDDFKYFTARRAYEFRQDDLRLSILCTPPVEQALNNLFHFRTTAMGSPQPTFGDVPVVYPPGYVFDLGLWVSPQGEVVPIRFIHFEAQRIVIDVAGKSSALTPIYELVREAIAPIQTVDGSAVIGTPHTVRDYSEITAHCAFSLDTILAPGVRAVVAKHFGMGRKETRALIPSFSAYLHEAGAVLENLSPATGFNFGIRVGTRPDEHVCFSSAPLESDVHAEYLSDLVHAFTSQ